jgi:hypothetical protein
MVRRYGSPSLLLATAPRYCPGAGTLQIIVQCIDPMKDLTDSDLILNRKVRNPSPRFRVLLPSFRKPLDFRAAAKPLSMGPKPAGKRFPLYARYWEAGKEPYT